MTEFALRDKPPPGFGFIYKITSPSGKSYIGQTRKSISSRMKAHAHPLYSKCRYLGNAIAKYGMDNMSVFVLGVFAVDDLNEQERLAICTHNTLTPEGYNLVSGGNARKQCSQETRLRMSLARKGIPRPEWLGAVISKALKGRKQSPESVAKRAAGIRRAWENPSEKQKASADNLRGVPLSEDHKAKLRAAKLNQSAETRAKISKALKGRIISPEWRAKVSASKRGKRPTQTAKLLASYSMKRKENRANPNQLVMEFFV
jgi:group I intron endonuclease